MAVVNGPYLIGYIDDGEPVASSYKTHEI